MIRVVAQTASTNVDLAALARDGSPEALWLVAERQTAGRGRQGRQWVSPPGNFHGSTLVRLRATDPAAPTLALVAAVAVQDAVAAYGVGAIIKWPNDLLFAGAKLAGILLERHDDAVIVGIGVNLSHAPDLPDRPATSVAASGVAVTPATFAETLAEQFARWLAVWRRDGLIAIRSAWLARAHPPGTALTVRLPDGEALDGLFAGLDGDGALSLRLADGSVRAIHAGDVFLL